MKKRYKLLYLFIIAGIATSCKKEEVEVVSLTKAGDEHYFGEKVLVYAPTIGNKDDVSYQWSTTGGYFAGPQTQNLFENLWVAPAEVGEYKVSVTAKNGRNSSSASTTMKVTRYFFDNFESPYTFTANGWAQSGGSFALVNSHDPSTSRVELTATGTGTGNIRRTLNLAPLTIPFSIQTKLGWKTYFKPDDKITIRLTFRQPVANVSYPFIREIRWEVWPTRNTTGTTYQMRFETYVPATATSRFNATTTPTTANPAPTFLINPVSGRNTDLLMSDGQLKTLTFSISPDNVFTANINGTNWITSNGIKDWLTFAKAAYPGFEDPVPQELRIEYPGKVGNNATVLVVKSVYINSDGTNLD